MGKNCPLHMPHPRAGGDAKKSAFPLGCSICRSEHLTEYDQAQAAISEMIEEEKQDFFHIDRTLHSSFQLGGKKGGKGGKGGKGMKGKGGHGNEAIHRAAKAQRAW